MVYIKVIEVITEKGLSMAKLARKADMDYKTVQRLCRDPYRNVDIHTLGRLADALEVDVSQLIESTIPKE